MAYDEALAERVREILDDVPGDAVSERKMFGGLAFMHRGNMVVGILGDVLMVRLGEEDAQTALRRKHVREMDFTGRTMSTMVYVDPEGLRGRALRAWVDKAVAFAETLPAKAGR